MPTVLLVDRTKKILSFHRFYTRNIPRRINKRFKLGLTIKGSTTSRIDADLRHGVRTKKKSEQIIDHARKYANNQLVRPPPPSSAVGQFLLLTQQTRINFLEPQTRRNGKCNHSFVGWVQNKKENGFSPNDQQALYTFLYANKKSNNVFLQE